MHIRPQLLHIPHEMLEDMNNHTCHGSPYLLFFYRSLTSKA